MLARAKVLGLTFDQTVLDNYKLPIPADCALTAIHESWKLFNGPPIPRSVDKNANLANSVRVRSAHDRSYRPRPLKFTKTGLSKQYVLDVIVTEDY
jgi:hypothetical protein